jgi:hypothetical protein
VTISAARRTVYVVRKHWGRLAAAGFGGLVAAGIVAVSSSATTRSHPPHLSERQILRIALSAAAALGDPRPTLMQHSEGTQSNANHVASGSYVGGSTWSYLIAERGHFIFKNAPRPIGAAAPRGTALALIVNASTGQISDRGLTRRYPRLGRLGPVRTDYRTYPACPVSDRRQLLSIAAGADTDLVPAGASRVLVCRYGGLNAGRANARLVGMNTVSARAEVDQVANQLDALQSFRSGGYACPADFGVKIIAIFRYPVASKSDDPVTVDPNGCSPVSNGHLVRTAMFAPGPSLINRLEALTRKAR